MKEASTHRNQMTDQVEEEPYGSCTSKNKVSTSQTNIVGSRAEGCANNGNQREEHLGQNSSLNLTGMDEMLDDNSSDLNEIGSSLYSTLVAVNGYRVKPEWASLLNAIFLRHGDNAKDCSFVGIRSRSSLLEIVCEIIQKLEDTEFIHIKPRLDVISEAIDLCKGYPRLTNAQRRRTEVIEKKKEELKSFNMEILDSEEQILSLQKKILTLKEKVLLAEDELTPMKAEAEKIAETISDTMAKVKRFHQKSLVDGLLQFNLCLMITFVTCFTCQKTELVWAYLKENPVGREYLN
ncbi:uncharacterized protein LOC132316336 [Cornus florida]|uniref:uncharacterized protein LOC132316336 n=1 Tax=Cornus florida TaxID=4283 RepID=UPI0028979D09|nr:uncharacterized protein LOC132316336 [Cornus florida]